MKPSFIHRAETSKPTKSEEAKQPRSNSKPSVKPAKKAAKKAAKKSTTKATPKPKTKTKTKTASKATSKSTPKTQEPDVHVPPPRARKRAKKHAKEIEEEPEEEGIKEAGFFDSLIKTTILFTLLTLALVVFIQRHDWGLTEIFKTTQFSKPKPDAEKYFALVDQLKSQRERLRQEYLDASTNAQKQVILSNASYVLEETLPQMMRCWLGHDYDFNGTATVPGEGKIACGYFVSVIMRDAGFDINRIRVAQQPSQNIIRTFVNTKQNFEVKVGTPYDEYVDHLINNYEGIQIIGLDTHVAFVVIKDGELRYIHASAGSARSVVDESKDQAYSLIHSNYRVISNISRNADVLRRWLLNDKFPTGGTQQDIR